MCGQIVRYEVGGDGPSSAAARTAEDFDAVLELDRRAFGTDRCTLLRALARDDRTRCCLARNGSGHSGYLFATEHRLGPGYANDAGAACEVVSVASRDSDTERNLRLPVESATSMHSWRRSACRSGAT